MHARILGPGPALVAVPLRTLLLLGAAVLAVHLLILQGAALQMSADAPPITRPFITRTLPATPAVQPAPRKPPQRRLARANPPPTPAITPPAAAIPAAVAAEQAAAADVPALPSGELAEQPPAPAAVAPPPEVQAPPASAVALPGSLRVHYKIRGEISQLPYSASGELLWLHDGKTYDARLEVGAFLLGSRVQTSRGLITPEGLAPTRFGDKVRSEVAAHFERDKGKVTFSANTPDVALQAGAQDQLSIFIQLAGLIGADPQRFPKGSTLEMQAVGARDAETWSVVVEGEELLQLPGGELATLKLKRASQKGYDLTVELWLAPALGYLPARIRLTQNNGDFIEQQLSGSGSP